MNVQKSKISSGYNFWVLVPLFAELYSRKSGWAIMARPRVITSYQSPCEIGLKGYAIKKILTLIRLTSERPCQDRGGGSGSPPYLSWLWSKFLLKNHVSPKAGINSNSFGPFSEFFFQKLQKNWRKLKTYQKLLKNERKFQIW